MEKIEGERFGQERALYNRKNIWLKDCRFEGEEDGESAVKQCENVVAKNCHMALRYPFWHVNGLTIEGGEMTDGCRAAMWYDRDVRIERCSMNGIKALRECDGVTVSGSTILSPEFGWKCRGIELKDCKLTSQYAFLDSERVTLDNVDFDGKYSFQYVRGMKITRSRLNTKDAFWHTSDVVVEDSEIVGEYLGWYSRNLTLVRCKIVGTQPLCYCEGLTLIDCTMEDCDLSFEYSDVEASVVGHIDSVKNVRSGYVRADSIGEVLTTEDSVYACNARIETKK